MADIAPVGERKPALPQSDLRESEERQAFLLKLSDTLRPLADPVEIQVTASRLLGKTLRASRVLYLDVAADGDSFVIDRDYVDGVASLAGRHKLSHYEHDVRINWLEGKTAIYADIDADVSLSAEQRAIIKPTQVAACLGVPLLKDGVLQAVLAVHQSKPRSWSLGEIALVEEVAERTWAAVERARAQAALRASEARLALAVDIGAIGHWEFDVETGDLKTSAICRRNFGQPEDREFSYHALLASIHPDDRARQAEAVATAVKTRSQFRIEYRLMMPGGETRWVDVRARFMDGERGRLVGVSQDITGRKRADLTLLETEERLQQFGDASQDVLWIREAETLQWTYLTPAFETIYGLDREAALRGDNMTGWLELIVPEDREHAANSLKRVYDGQWVTFEFRIRRPIDGGIRWMRDTDFPIRDALGKVVLIGGIGRDVTAMKEAEQALAAIELRQRALIEGVPQHIWRSIDHGHWTWASPQWTRFTGQAEANSHGWGWLKMLHPDDRAAARAAWERSKSTGVFEVEYRLRQHADSRFCWFSARATPVYDDQGALVEWLGTSTDVNDLRRLQGRQQVLLGELQHRVRNSLAVIRSIARRTAATSETVEELSMHLDGRLAAFARTQAAVTRAASGGVDLRDTIVDELLAHAAREGEQVHVRGSEIVLQPKAGETLALAFHELATNAVKYGGLSKPDGQVRVSWDLAADMLTIRWDEARPGAPLAPPSRRGFGTELLEDTLAYELEAETTLDFRATGLLCTIRLPATGALIQAQ